MLNNVSHIWVCLWSIVSIDDNHSIQLICPIFYLYCSLLHRPWKRWFSRWLIIFCPHKNWLTDCGFWFFIVRLHVYNTRGPTMNMWDIDREMQTIPLETASIQFGWFLLSLLLFWLYLCCLCVSVPIWSARLVVHFGTRTVYFVYLSDRFMPAIFLSHRAFFVYVSWLPFGSHQSECEMLDRWLYWYRLFSATIVTVQSRIYDLRGTLKNAHRFEFDLKIDW